LFDYALQLHRASPDSPRIGYEGAPWPDAWWHPRRGRARRSYSRSLRNQRREHETTAAVLDEHFTKPSASLRDLAEALHDVGVPKLPDEEIAAVAGRGDAQLVRETGRWLVRHATDRCAVLIGLALLDTVEDQRDIPLIQTIALLSGPVGALAIDMFTRWQGTDEVLMWLAERLESHSRTDLVELYLCPKAETSEMVRQWLLRHACNGGYLDHYLAGEVATVTHLHEVITTATPDPEVVDHTGVLLATMIGSENMGMTLEHYPHACTVIEAHVNHSGRLEPTAERYYAASKLGNYLRKTAAEQLFWPQEHQERVANKYLRYASFGPAPT
jgi:hypothetical protein